VECKKAFIVAPIPRRPLFTVCEDFTGDEIKIAITCTGAPVANLKTPGVAGFTRLKLGSASDRRCADEIGGDDRKN